MTTSGAPTGGRSRGSAAARLRLVRRAAAALVPLENAEVQADVENQPIGPDQVEPRLLRTDLMITASDLRLRVSMLPSMPATALDEEETRRAALTLLLHFPETSAVVVVADDDDLTAKIIEPSDGHNAIQSSLQVVEGEPRRHGPLGDVVRAYLRQVTSDWELVSPLVRAQEDFRSEARAIGAEKLQELQAARKNTPEWRAARMSLGQSDAAWAAELAIRLRLDPDLDALQLLQEHARHSRHAGPA